MGLRPNFKSSGLQPNSLPYLISAFQHGSSWTILLRHCLQLRHVPESLERFYLQPLNLLTLATGWEKTSVQQPTGATRASPVTRRIHRINWFWRSIWACDKKKKTFHLHLQTAPNHDIWDLSRPRLHTEIQDSIPIISNLCLSVYLFVQEIETNQMVHYRVHKIITPRPTRARSIQSTLSYHILVRSILIPSFHLR
jgi:hypothetical protein